jgi:hypothetical protein
MKLLGKFLIGSLFLIALSNNVIAAESVKKWSDLKLVIVELNDELKPVDKKEVPLYKPFNASNDIFKIDFSHLFDEKNLEKKLNIQSNSTNILQRFTSPEQAINWASQIKVNGGKTYYFLINKN